MRREVEINGFPAEIEIRNGVGSVSINGRKFDVKLHKDSADLIVEIEGKKYRVRVIDDYVAFINGRFVSYRYVEKPPIKRVDGVKKEKERTYSRDKIFSPIAGRVNEVLIKPGRKISPGDTVVILESMKMLIEVKSELEGIVEEVLVKEGDVVTKGQPLVKLAEVENRT